MADNVAITDRGLDFRENRIIKGGKLNGDLA